MNLVYYPDEILSKAATPIDVENPQVDLVQLKEDMLDVMIKSRGLGLSACQVGLPWKVFVMGETKEAAIMVVNPEIIAYSEETNNEPEGCLSFPDVFLRVNRPNTVSAKWLDENLKPQEGTIEGYGARCFLHEHDHLMGVVYKEKVSRLKWDRAQKKKEKIVKQRRQVMQYIRNMEEFEKNRTLDPAEEVDKKKASTTLDLNTGD
jgi:peptide deformylase